ncbi:MAG: hypothetical protein ACOYY2_01560, partial [Actinomycetota bacterium]
MGLTDRLRAAAAARPHLLLLTVPAATAARVAVERAARLRGWPLAATPADADVLVTVGPLGTDSSAVADRLSAAMPLPRIRVAVRDAAEAAAVLDQVPGRLRSAAA